MFKTLIVATTLVASVGAIDLTADNFDTEVSADKTALVKFFAPWCGHCKRMAPAWAQLTTEFASSDKVVIGDVDCTIHKDLCSRFGVRGYPTLKAFKNGEPVDYNSGRSFDDLKKYVEENLQ